MKEINKKYDRNIVSACISSQDLDFSITQNFTTSKGPVPECIKKIFGKFIVDGDASFVSTCNVREIYDDLLIKNNPYIRELHLPEVVSVSGSLHIENCPNLVIVNAPCLNTVGVFFEGISESGYLKLFAGNVASDAYNIIFRNLPALTTVNLPSLSFIMQHFEISDTPELSKVKVPKNVIVGGAVTLSGCLKLKTARLVNSLKRAK